MDLRFKIVLSLSSDDIREIVSFVTEYLKVSLRLLEIWDRIKNFGHKVMSA